MSTLNKILIEKKNKFLKPKTKRLVNKIFIIFALTTTFLIGITDKQNYYWQFIMQKNKNTKPYRLKYNFSFRYKMSIIYIYENIILQTL